MTTLEAISQLSEDVAAVLLAFTKMRDETSEDEWDQFNDHPLLSPLLDCLADLEHTAEIE
jgi:hypothetical protein